MAHSVLEMFTPSVVIACAYMCVSTGVCPWINFYIALQDSMTPSDPIIDSILGKQRVIKW